MGLALSINIVAVQPPAFAGVIRTAIRSPGGVRARLPCHVPAMFGAGVGGCAASAANETDAINSAKNFPIGTIPESFFEQPADAA
jgi:hypothetical protein